ncbi:hypothetical protein [Levilactobacillus spicheri]
MGAFLSDDGFAVIDEVRCSTPTSKLVEAIAYRSARIGLERSRHDLKP